MATGPKFPNSPLELLESDVGREPSFFSKMWPPCICAAVSFMAVCGGNWASRRPVFSGIQKHVFFTAAGAYIGRYVDDYRNQYFADRDAMFRHYITLHPEDFPPYEKKKFAEVFVPWQPIR